MCMVSSAVLDGQCWTDYSQEPLVSMATPFRLVTETLTDVVVDTVATVLVAEWELETLKVTELTED